MNIDRNPPPNKEDVEKFISSITFQLPKGYVEFLQESNGADISFENAYLMLWPLTDLVHLNKEYTVDEYAPDFFLIGSDGGDTAYAISKDTGNIYEMPFVGMANEEATFISNDFNDLLSELSK